MLKRALKSHGKTFSKAQLTALSATAVDFGALYSLVEHAHVHYVAATAMGAFAGAVTNFLLNRYWAFESRSDRIRLQGFRYGLVAAGSLGLNTGLVFFFTEFGRLRYLTSKVIAALLVGWVWNYPLHRYYVFPRKDDRHV